MDESSSNVVQFSPDGRRFALVLKRGNIECNTNDYILEIFADQGHNSAEINLLLQHVFGQTRSLQPEAVVIRLQKLAEPRDREAQNILGLCYQHGYGTPQNYQEAAIWFRRAAEGGLGTAQFNLGGLYYEGWGLR